MLCVWRGAECDGLRWLWFIRIFVLCFMQIPWRYARDGVRWSIDVNHTSYAEAADKKQRKLAHAFKYAHFVQHTNWPSCRGICSGTNRQSNCCLLATSCGIPREALSINKQAQQLRRHSWHFTCILSLSPMIWVACRSSAPVPFFKRPTDGQSVDSKCHRRTAFLARPINLVATCDDKSAALMRV